MTEEIKKQIKAYEEEGLFERAMDLAKEAGLTEKVIDIYEKCGSFGFAAYHAKEEGLFDLAEDLSRKGVDYHEKKGEFYDAARCAAEIGLSEKARELVDKAEEKGDVSIMDRKLVERIIEEYGK